MDFNISFNNTVTSYKIYSEVLPQIYKIYNNKINLLQLETLQFDLYEIDDIDSLAIPLLISIAENLRKDLKKITLILPYKIKPKSILYLYGFTKNEYLRNLFSIDKNEIGGIDLDLLYINTRLEILDYYKTGKSKENIEYELNTFFNNQARSDNKNGLIRFLQNIDTKYLFDKNSYYKQEEELTWILKNVFSSIYKVCIEFIINACYHGKTKCYFLYRYEKEYNKVFFSITDTGQGLVNSFNNNKHDLFFVNNKEYNNYDKDLLYIIEAVSYRYHKKGFGIYDVAQIITSLNGKIRYHYNTTQCLFTYDLFKKVKDKYDFSEIIEIYQKELENKEKSDKYRKARKTTEFKGVHVEIELQLEKYDWRIFKDVSSKYFNNQK